jgi:hypothetical protein
MMATQKAPTREQRRARRKVQEPVMPARRWRLARKRIWEDMTGCECRRVIVVGGKTVTLRRDEMCTKDAIRCNGRLRRFQKDAEKLGPEPTPLPTEESSRG